MKDSKRGTFSIRAEKKLWKQIRKYCIENDTTPGELFEKLFKGMKYSELTKF